MIKKIIVFGLIFFLIVTIYSLARQIFLALNAGNRLNSAADTYNHLEEENRKLAKHLTEVQKDTYIEEQAREKLNLARPNETVILIPQEEIDKVVQFYQPKAEAQTPNWQKWLNLVFK